MGARYVWNRYTAISQIGYRTRYRAVSESVSSFKFSLSQGDQFTISSSYSISQSTGNLSQSGILKTYTVARNTDYGAGYIKSTSGEMYYASNWHSSLDGLTGFKLTGSNGVTKYTSEAYQQQYTYYIQGSYLDQRSSASSGAYPSNDESGGYYYVRQGSDQVDPTAVTVPDDIDDGTTITISLTPNTGKTFGGTIS